jgi:hypothetical protein
MGRIIPYHILWKIKNVPNHQPDMQTLHLISFCTVHGWKRAPSQARACMGASKNWGYNNTTIRLPFKYADRSRPFLTKTCLLRIMWQTNARATTIMTGDGSITTHTHGDLGLGACPPRCLELSAAVAEAPQSDSLTKKMRLGSLAKTKLQCHRQLRIVYILYTYMKYRWKNIDIMFKYI